MSPRTVARLDRRWFVSALLLLVVARWSSSSVAVYNGGTRTAGSFRRSAASPVVAEVAINGLRRRRDLDGAAFPVGSPVVVSWTLLAVERCASLRVRVDGDDARIWSSSGVPCGATDLRLPDDATRALAPASSYAVRVGVVDDDGATSSWSRPVRFGTAPAEWEWDDVEWVGGGSELRTDVVLGDDVARARAYASGLGAFELHVNGARAGADRFLDPGRSAYDATTLFVAFDLTRTLRRGTNAVGARLGNGDWGYLDAYVNRTEIGDQSGDSTRAFSLLLRIELRNGTTLRIPSRASDWWCRAGPIVYDHLWHGEVYDARRELRAPAWDEAPAADYPEGTWGPARRMTPRVGRREPATIPPVRVVETWEPVSASVRRYDVRVVDPWRDASPRSPRAIFDFGRNVAGHTTIVVPVGAASELLRRRAATTNATATPPALVLRVAHAEITDERGEAYNNFYPGMESNHTSRTCDMADWYAGKWYECANQTDAVILGVENEEEKGEAWLTTRTFTPHFTYHGFRFAELTATLLDPITGEEEPLPPDMKARFPFGVSLVANRVRTDLERRTVLDLPDGILKSIYDATLASHESNLMSIPTDCPQREKRGWAADAGVTSASLAEFFDAAAFHANFLRRFADDQDKTERRIASNPDEIVNGTCVVNGPASRLRGSVPDVVPFTTPPYGNDPGSVDWQSAFVLVAGNLLRAYGRTAAVPTLERVWPHLRRLTDYLDRHVDDDTGLLLCGARGDWIPPPNTARRTGTAPVAAFFHALCSRYMADVAEALDLPAEAERYAARFEANRRAYHDKFHNASSDDDCCYESGSQTNNVLASYLGAASERPDVANRTIAALLRSLRDRRPAYSGEGDDDDGPHLDVGVFGATYVFDVLSAAGLADVGLEILSRTTYPSFGYMVEQGATTLWEGWTGTRHAIGQATSRNHVMFGGGVALFLARHAVGLPYPASRQSDDGALVAEPSLWAFENLPRASGRRRLPGIGGGWAVVRWWRSSSAEEAAEAAPRGGLVFEWTLPVGARGPFLARLPLLFGADDSRVDVARSGDDPVVVVVAWSCGDDDDATTPDDDRPSLVCARGGPPGETTFFELRQRAERSAGRTWTVRVAPASGNERSGAARSPRREQEESTTS